MNDLKLITIPSGTFRMGSPEDEKDRDRKEGPQHEVSISAFACMLYPVTRQLYAAVTGEDPIQGWFEYVNSSGHSVTGWNSKPDALPAGWVTWFDVIRFCNALSRLEGLAPCYDISGEDKISATTDPGIDLNAMMDGHSGAIVVKARDGVRVDWNRAAAGYRLPTEAEWEFACRAGTTTLWSHGDDESVLERYAWYRDNANGRPHAVGEKSPNPWGLFDMHGNVFEWCYDALRDYTAEHARDPVEDTQSNRRALRGGSCVATASSARSALRHSTVWSKRSSGVGFRCVRNLDSAHPGAIA